MRETSAIYSQSWCEPFHDFQFRIRSLISTKFLEMRDPFNREQGEIFFDRRFVFQDVSNDKNLENSASPFSKKIRRNVREISLSRIYIIRTFGWVAIQFY